MIQLLVHGEWHNYLPKNFFKRSLRQEKFLPNGCILNTVRRLSLELAITYMSSVQHWAILCNTVQYCAKLGNTGQYCAILCNTYVSSVQEQISRQPLLWTHAWVVFQKGEEVFYVFGKEKQHSVFWKREKVLCILKKHKYSVFWKREEVCFGKEKKFSVFL